MKQKLIDLLSKITLSDLTSEQRTKAGELLSMLKERKKRSSPVPTKSLVEVGD